MIFVLTNSSTLQAQSAENLKEEFLRTYDPQGYSYYKFSTGIVEQGKQIANNLSQNLSRSKDLVNTTDPDVLLADFNNKMQQIESLEQSFIEQSNQFGFEQGQQLGEMISSGDSKGILYGGLGMLNALSENREAKEELEAKKAELKEQRRQKMSEIYWKAIEYNENTQENYLNRAAYAEDIKDEEYNLEFIKNLKCHARLMESSWSSSNTRWLKNTCPKPQKPSFNTIENKFVAKDVQYKQIAKRKYDYYKKSGHEEFLKAAISYAAAAAEENETAANYYQIGLYYEEESTILALSSMLTAQQLNPNFFDGDKTEVLNRITQDAEINISMALNSNDKEYIKAFLEAGLDRTIKISGNSMMNRAIQLDQPDAMQLILNSYIDGLDQKQTNEKLQKVIMLSATNNSTACIKRFIDLGVDTDFKINGYTPVDIANKVQAEDAYKLLVEHSGRESYYEKKYGASETQFFATAKENPSSAALLLDTFSTDDERISLVEKLLDRIQEDSAYAEVIRQNEFANTYIRSTPTLNEKVKRSFLKQLKTASPASKSHLYVQAGLIAQESIPLLSEIKVSGIEQKTDESYQNSFNMEKKIGLLLKWYQDSFDKVKQQQTNQYYTEEMKADGLNGIKNGIRNITAFKNSIGSLSETDKRDIDAQIYSMLATDAQGNFQKHDQKFLDYVTNQYQVVDEVDPKDKIRLNIKNLKETELKTGNDLSGVVKIFQGYLSKSELSSYELFAINSSYGASAIRYNHPLDKPTLANITGNASLGSETSQEEPEVDLEYESIVYAAFVHGNYELFAALDEIHDLSTIKNGKGSFLFHSILSQPDKMLSNIAYFSKDFDFSSNINGTPAVLKFLESGFSKDKKIEELGILDYEEYPALPSASILQMTGLLFNYYDLPKDLKVTSKGGTLYHYAMNKLIDDELTIMQVNGLFAELDKNMLDKTAKDQDGKTAYDLFKKNDRDIEKRWRSLKKDILKKHGVKGIGVNAAIKYDWGKQEERLLRYIKV